MLHVSLLTATHFRSVCVLTLVSFLICFHLRWFVATEMAARRTLHIRTLNAIIGDDGSMGGCFADVSHVAPSSLGILGAPVAVFPGQAIP